MVERTKRSREELDRLWKKYAQTRDNATRNLLAEAHLSVVHAIAFKMNEGLPHSVQVEDLITAGTFGLLEAIRRFDPARGVQFKTYCAGRVRGAMLDELRHVDPVPRLMRSRANRLRKAHLKLERQHGRAPRDIEVAREMGLPLGDLDALYREVRVALPAELHRRPLEKDETLLGLELLEDAGAEDPLRQSGDNELIRFCLGKLTRRDAFVFVLYFLEERTLKEIGWILGLSESRVCQLQARISVRLQGKLKPRTVVA